MNKDELLKEIIELDTLITEKMALCDKYLEEYIDKYLEDHNGDMTKLSSVEILNLRNSLPHGISCAFYRSELKTILNVRYGAIKS